MRYLLNKMFPVCCFQGGVEGAKPPSKLKTFATGMQIGQAATGMLSDLYTLGEGIASYKDRRKLMKQQGRLGELQIQSLEEEMKAKRKDRRRLTNIRNMLLRGNY